MNIKHNIKKIIFFFSVIYIVGVINIGTFYRPIEESKYFISKRGNVLLKEFCNLPLPHYDKVKLGEEYHIQARRVDKGNYYAIMHFTLNQAEVNKLVQDIIQTGEYSLHSEKRNAYIFVNKNHIYTPIVEFDQSKNICTVMLDTINDPYTMRQYIDN